MSEHHEGAYPLEGIKVLELGHYIAAPYATMILGDQGAEVIKVEPLGGEPGRRAFPRTDDGESLYFASYNRNKRTIELDLLDHATRPVLERLIAQSDVLVTNFSLGVPERLGFGWPQVSKHNPKLVMVHITGFGSWSLLRDYAAYDPIVQAMAGIAHMTGEPDGSPYLSNVMFGDHVTAVQAAMAASSGLHLRNRTGKGSFVEVSMMRSVVGLLGDLVPQHTVLQQEPRRHGNRSPLRFGGMYATCDGFVWISPITPAMWKRFCSEIGQAHWGEERIARERINVFDAEFRAQVEDATSRWMEKRSTQQVLERFQGNGIPCGAVRSVAEVCHSDEESNLRLLEDVELVSGSSARVVGRSFDWDDGQRPRPRIPSDDTEEILSDLGLSRGDLGGVHHSGAVGVTVSDVHE